MNKKINVRNLIIIMLCITIICLGIGFVFLSTKLEEVTTKQNTFDIVFSKVEAKTAVKGGQNTPTGTNSITNQGSTVTFNLNLNVPYDELAYNIIIKNEGTLPAEIINILETPDYLNDASAQQKIYPVTINHNDVIGKILAPGEETELRITATYNLIANPTPKKINYQLSLLATTPKEN